MQHHHDFCQIFDAMMLSVHAIIAHIIYYNSNYIDIYLFVKFVNAAIDSGSWNQRAPSHLWNHSVGVRAIQWPTEGAVLYL
jgi:hypothetical protein